MSCLVTTKKEGGSKSIPGVLQAEGHQHDHGRPQHCPLSCPCLVPPSLAVQSLGTQAVPIPLLPAAQITPVGIGDPIQWRSLLVGPCSVRARTMGPTESHSPTGAGTQPTLINMKI